MVEQNWWKSLLIIVDYRGPFLFGVIFVAKIVEDWLGICHIMSYAAEVSEICSSFINSTHLHI